VGTPTGAGGTRVVGVVRILTLEYMSKHALIIFLAANVLTGAVNISVRTIYLSTATSLVILSAYMLIVASLSWKAQIIFNFLGRLVTLMRKCRTKAGDS
jgi:hypothetical protein